MKYYLSVETPDDETTMLRKLESAGLSLMGKRRFSDKGMGNFTEEELAQALETGERGEVYGGFVHLSQRNGDNAPPTLHLDESAKPVQEEINNSLAMTGLGRRALEIQKANDRLAAEGRQQAADFSKHRLAQLDAGRR